MGDISSTRVAFFSFALVTDGVYETHLSDESRLALCMKENLLCVGESVRTL